MRLCHGRWEGFADFELLPEKKIYNYVFLPPSFTWQPHGLAAEAVPHGPHLRRGPGQVLQEVHLRGAQQRGLGEGAAGLQQGIQHARGRTVPQLRECNQCLAKKSVPVKWDFFYSSDSYSSWFPIYPFLSGIPTQSGFPYFLFFPAINSACRVRPSWSATLRWRSSR